jgi:hypothetical protein
MVPCEQELYITFGFRPHLSIYILTAHPKKMKQTRTHSSSNPTRAARTRSTKRDASPNTKATGTTKRRHTKAQKPSLLDDALELPVKDYSIHRTAHVTGYRGEKGFCMSRIKVRRWMQRVATRIIMRERPYEKEVRRHMRNVHQGLKSGERTDLGDIFKAPFKLYCEEFYSHYLDHERDWTEGKSMPSITFHKKWKNADPQLACDSTEMCAEIKMFKYVKPGINAVLPFERPKQVDLVPQEIEFRVKERGTYYGAGHRGGSCKLWFLGNGYLRLEMNVELYTGEPGKLMWSGIQSASCDQHLRDEWQYIDMDLNDLCENAEEEEDSESEEESEEESDSGSDLNSVTDEFGGGDDDYVEQVPQAELKSRADYLRAQLEDMERRNRLGDDPHCMDGYDDLVTAVAEAAFAEQGLNFADYED